VIEMDENKIPFSEEEMDDIYQEFLEERKYYENHPEEAIKYIDEKAKKDNESLRKQVLTLLIVLVAMFLAISFFGSIGSVDATNRAITNTTTGGLKVAINNVDNHGIVYLEDGVYSGGNNTNLSIKKNLAIIGKSKGNTILDAQGNSRIFTIIGEYDVILINLTFINGKSDIGGAIFNLDGELMIYNCSFVNNSAKTIMVVLFIIGIVL